MAKLKCLSPEDLHVTNKIKVLTEESERAKPNGKFLISCLCKCLMFTFKSYCMILIT